MSPSLASGPRTIARAAAVTALLLPAAAWAWDLANETVDARYDTLSFDRLSLHCHADGIVAGIACGGLLEVPAYPADPSDGGTRAIIPRPADATDPAAGVIPRLDLAKTGDAVDFHATDLGIWYPLTFTAHATRVGPETVRWEGVRAQNFCVVQDFGGVFGKRVVRVSQMGANLCTTVSQRAAPRDVGDHRFYKGFTLASAAACTMADPALIAQAEASAWSRASRKNFVTVVAWNGAPEAAESAAYDAQLAAERAAARVAGRPEPADTVLPVADARCTHYGTLAGPDDLLHLTLSIEAASGDVGRRRVSPEVRNPTATLTSESWVCRQVADTRLPPPPVTVRGHAAVVRRAAAPTSADDEQELGQVPVTAFAVELDATPARGVAVTPANVRFDLPAPGGWSTDLAIDLQTIGGRTDYSGPVVLRLRSSTLGGAVLAEHRIDVVTTTRACKVPRLRHDRLPPYIVRRTINAGLDRGPLQRVVDAMTKAQLRPTVRPSVVPRLTRP